MSHRELAGAENYAFLPVKDMKKIQDVYRIVTYHTRTRIILRDVKVSQRTLKADAAHYDQLSHPRVNRQAAAVAKVGKWILDTGASNHMMPLGKVSKHAI